MADSNARRDISDGGCFREIEPGAERDSERSYDGIAGTGNVGNLVHDGGEVMLRISGDEKGHAVFAACDQQGGRSDGGEQA